MERIKVNRKRMLETAEYVWLRYKDHGLNRSQSWRFLLRWASGYWDL